MKVRINIITAARALRRNKLRAGLSMIGIIIGISSVIAMMGLGSSANIAINDKIHSYGSNAMAIQILRGKNFSSNDMLTMKQYMPQIKYITPVSGTSEKDAISIHRYRQKNHKALLYFTSEDYFFIQGRKAASGRLFTDNDIKSSAKVAVIGTTVLNKLFAGAAPIGKIITINNFPFTVIGVLDKKGEALSGRDFDNITVIPYTSGLQRFENKTTFDTINVSTNYAYEIVQVKQQITNYILRKYFPGSDNPKGFIEITTSDDKLKMARDIT
ncbi:MAG: ABC transporter permease, partial [Spirochaetia bacterium]|nr:ABC transporter permease [Spirochaetia bacterium]